MERATTNQVRQILMNELGLSRESIRDEVRSIAIEAVNRYFSSKQFEDFLRVQVDAALRTYHYGQNELRSFVGSAVAEAVRKEITANLSFQITSTFPASPSQEPPCEKD